MKNSKLFTKINAGYEKVLKTIDNMNALLSKYTQIVSHMELSQVSIDDLLKPLSYIDKTFSDLKEKFNDYHLTVHEIITVRKS